MKAVVARGAPVLFVAGTGVAVALSDDAQQSPASQPVAEPSSQPASVTTSHPAVRPPERIEVIDGIRG
jgi:hypothetical protein